MPSSSSPPAADAAAATAAPSAASTASAILGVGAFAPEAVLSNADLERLVDTSDTWILERTGIRERRRGGPAQTASVMATAAARAALQRAGNPTVGAVIVATASPDTLFPSVSCLVQRRLGLGAMPAFDISAACSGFLYALVTADAMIRTGVVGTALVVAAESMTSLVDYSDRSTCVLFGDGAGAVVLGGVGAGGIRASHLGADGGEADLIHYGPKPEGGGDGRAHIQMVGKGTFRLAVERMCEAARICCNATGWRVEELDHVVPHQANLRIVDAVAKRLGLRREQLIVNGDRYGNTSAASIPLALADADAAGRLRSGDKIVCVAFGAGATWGGVALEWALDPAGAS